VKDEALSLFLDFDSLTIDRKEITFFSLFEEVMLLAIAVNSQYSNMKNRLLGQQIEIALSKLPIKIPTLRDNFAWRANEQPVSL